MTLQRIADWLTAHSGQRRLAVRTTVGALTTFALAHLLRLPQPYWAVLTSVIVMQASVGGGAGAQPRLLTGTAAR